ncbi:hypothetical protein JM18_003147 [Phytophthora kernoviae]|uniref:Transmembrane protein 198 n=2 Tax=Phytophthora kernoviae TaxID=325452 RepID=A0A921VBL3_9STRA|nr:hypothetical protein G195_004224 [Phytophthora kernoviae 00238/432]KAG2528854.1 hypothetical protein JM18_003147 [Phytophthora kernoviae]
MLHAPEQLDGRDVLLMQDQMDVTCGIVIQTKLQKMLFKGWGQTLVMDFTHGTNNLGYHLAHKRNGTDDDECSSEEDTSILEGRSNKKRQRDSTRVKAQEKENEHCNRYSKSKKRARKLFDAGTISVLNRVKTQEVIHVELVGSVAMAVVPVVEYVYTFKVTIETWMELVLATSMLSDEAMRRALCDRLVDFLYELEPAQYQDAVDKIPTMWLQMIDDHGVFVRVVVALINNMRLVEFWRNVLDGLVKWLKRSVDPEVAEIMSVSKMQQLPMDTLTLVLCSDRLRVPEGEITLLRCMFVLNDMDLGGGIILSFAGSSSDSIVGAVSDKLEVGPSIAAVIAIVTGAVVATFGFKLLRPTMFACGFLVGGYIISAIVEYAVDGQSYERTAFWIAFLIGGIIVGSLVVSVYNAGIFLIGAAGGIFLATIVNASFGYRIYPNDPTTGLLILAIVLGLLCGILAFKLERLAVITATALVGSVLLVNGAGYFIGDFPTLTDIKGYRHKDEEGDYVYDVPTAWWGYLIAIIAVVILGCLVQIKKTGKK